MAPNRVRGFATVWPSSVAAGIIDSSSGSASVTPTPRRNVRRDRCALRDEGHHVSRRSKIRLYVCLYFFTRF